MPVGEVSVNYLFIEPFDHPKNDLSAASALYWRHKTPVHIGHWGDGESAVTLSFSLSSLFLSLSLTLSFSHTHTLSLFPTFCGVLCARHAW